MEAIYITCIVVLLCVVFFLVHKLYKFSLIILSIEDALEDSLDILNEKYSKINEIAQKPVFFDSVEVREVISEIKASHEAILIIANKLTYGVGLESEFKEEDN
tara:strand:- start:91 stop:399 length:309 start_codon:yes stop_codon:yes gene_type:complete